MCFGISCALLLLSCANNQVKTTGLEPTANKSAPKPDEKPVASSDATPTADCNAALWKNVYDPDRLQVIEKCKTVTGVIEESNADPDGDQHMLLKLDKGQKDLLTKKNKSKKDGDLVIEVVCANKISRKRAMGACTGYINNISLPAVGDHVKVTGSFVLDSHNGWNEIHPVSSIEKIK